MGRRLTILLAALAILVAITAGSAAAGSKQAKTHVYAVQLTIAVQEDAGRITGEVVTKAPSGFCDSSKIRISRMDPGKDEVVAKLKPHDGKWNLQSTPSLRGKRVYAEVSGYQLPQRPVKCLPAHSQVVTAP